MNFTVRRMPGPWNRDGTGLGLSIARQIIERHDGQIWAQSRLGQGTTVSFTLLKSHIAREQHTNKITLS